MQPVRALPRVGALLALVAATLILAGSGAVAPKEASAQETECVATGTTLDEARDAYEAACTAPRVDCDPVEDIWLCSSAVIGDSAPGGVTPTPVIPDPPTPTATEPPTPDAPAPTPPAAESPTPPPVAEPDDDSGESDDTISTPVPSQTPSPPVDDTSSPAPETETTPDPEPAPDEAEPTTTEPQPAPNVGTGPSPVVRTQSITSNVVERSYPPIDGPRDNPMKGWSSGWSDDRPESSVGFQYLKWSDLEPSNGDFDFAAVEDIINRRGSNGRHLILRLYCDWWGESDESHGCPDWIYSEVGVKRLEGDNGRFITDYNDSRYVDEAIQAIQALADRYDDDPRLYTFELGVLGYWGEWHTWGSQVDGSPYEIRQDTESRILGAYQTAFDRVHVMGRQPWGSTLSRATNIGFHNDYFRPNNSHSARFDQSVADGDRWLNGPIGGEIPPGLSSRDVTDLYATSQGADMIDRGHYSTMKAASDTGQFDDAHMALHRRFGYDYQIQAALFTASQPVAGETNVVLTAKNVGVAPFYYDWQVQFSLLAADGTVAAITKSTSYDLRDAKPGDVFRLTGALEHEGLAPGDYQLGVRILQPGADQPKSSPWGLDARNSYLLFSSDVPVIDGRWTEANELIGGWSILGTTSVT